MPCHPTRHPGGSRRFSGRNAHPEGKGRGATSQSIISIINIRVHKPTSVIPSEARNLPPRQAQGGRGMPSPFCVSKPLSVPLSEGEIRGCQRSETQGVHTPPI